MNHDLKLSLEPSLSGMLNTYMLVQMGINTAELMEKKFKLVKKNVSKLCPFVQSLT